MEMWGEGYSDLFIGWWKTSVFFRLTSSPKNWVVSTKQGVDRHKAISVCATCDMGSIIGKETFVDQLFYGLCMGL